jgi:thymidylate synthase
MKTFTNIHEAYLGALADVYDNPDNICSPRGQRVREKLYYMFQISEPKSESIITKDLDRNKTILDYTKKECDLYNSGTNQSDKFGEASKMWLKLANPDGTVNSAYGHLIKYKKSHGNPIYELFDQMQMMNTDDIVDFLAENARHAMRTPWQWCVDALKEDKDTRQAILRFSLPEHFYKGNKDMTCTLDGNFHIRNDKLLFRVHMRSNDLTLGLVYDLPWFISLAENMVQELSVAYPGLTVGPYTHIVDSLHIYDRDEDRILKMLGRK